MDVPAAVADVDLAPRLQGYFDHAELLRARALAVEDSDDAEELTRLAALPLSRVLREVAGSRGVLAAQQLDAAVAGNAKVSSCLEQEDSPSVLEFYVEMFSWLLDRDANICVGIEIPRGKFETMFEKAGIFLSNTLWPYDTSCSKCCASVQLMKKWTGHDAHVDHVSVGGVDCDRDDFVTDALARAAEVVDDERVDERAAAFGDGAAADSEEGPDRGDDGRGAGVDSARRQGAWPDVALCVKPEWLEKILREKTVDLRGTISKKAGTRFGLICSGTSTVWGECTVECRGPLTKDELLALQPRHLVHARDDGEPDTADELRARVKYRNCYAWVIKDAVVYETGFAYVHPRGAIGWVDLTKSVAEHPRFRQRSPPRKSVAGRPRKKGKTTRSF
ncbi:ASCH domain containing protein [Aureococcus anophagefferens]|nr:ASCH domain containing protein [Aureococcus anophagefferens]